MIEKGILAFMIIFTINGAFIIFGLGGDFNNPQTSLNLLPTGLNPVDTNSAAININVTDAGIESPPTNIFEAVTATIVDFILSLPLVGDTINVVVTAGGTFFKFLFYWTIVLDAMGLPAPIVFLIKIPLVVFQLGILFFILITIIQTFVGVFK